jgi:hypothetical protein
MGTDRYIEGFLDGQAVTYCEAVRLGSKVAAHLVCDAAHAERLAALIEREGCGVMIEPQAQGRRASLWIYRHPVAAQLIVRLQSANRTEVEMFAMGKVFGYADHAVLDYMQSNRATSVSAAESSPRLSGGTDG